MDNEMMLDKLSDIGIEATKEVIRQWNVLLPSLSLSDAICVISIKLSIYLFYRGFYYNVFIWYIWYILKININIYNIYNYIRMWKNVLTVK